jgi:AraC family transcriptional regulator of adaptative response/methylated-DNA-[protein]-cysteine methyltransferase
MAQDIEPQDTRASAVDPERAWAAVLGRDARQDGRFVFAVTSTGIYCRPSCPARRPARQRVEFYTTPGAAESAGYRACRRCHPSGAGPEGLAGRLERARLYLEEHLDETVSLARLGREVGLSPYHLQRSFKRRLGVTPREYVEARRMRAVKSRLKKGDTVTQATFEAGFGAGSRLYEHADAHLGMTPGTFRRGGRGMHIRYTVAPSPLGPLLVAATERGLAAVMLGESESELSEALGREYPAATLERDGEALASWVGTVLHALSDSPSASAFSSPTPSNRAGLSGPGPAPDLPLDLQGTAFEMRVWKALREIPHGATRTYGEIAAALGQPTAARAVARACAANRLAIVVPCHRVVPAAGGVGGYRWGAEKKRRLLAAERHPEVNPALRGS